MIGEAPRRHVVGFTDRFEEQWAEAGEPSDMLLVYADTPDFQTQVLIGLPTAEMMAGHPGFKLIDKTDLPKGRSS
jgi:hypothetical protein